MNIKTTFLFTVILTVAQVLASTPVSNDVEIPLLDGTTTWAPEPVSEIRSLDRSGHYFRAVLHSTTSEMNEFSKDLRIAYYSAAVFLLALSLMCTVAVKSTVGTSTFWAFLTFATMANAFGLQVTRNHKNQQLALPVIALGMLEVAQVLGAMLYFMYHENQSTLQQGGALVFLPVRLASLFMLIDATELVLDDLGVARAAGDNRDWSRTENKRRRQ